VDLEIANVKEGAKRVVEHTVHLQKWWTWLGRTGISPRETILRNRLRELLK
jgi:hypothetical protein